MKDCGGCQGIGAHKRFCPEVHGRHAWMRYRWSQQAENLADEVGANQPGRANILYQLAGFWRAEAQEASIEHMKRITEETRRIENLDFREPE